MITAIVTAPSTARELHVLLSSLVPAAADGLVRQVLVLDGGVDDGARELCDDAGADVLAVPLAQAASGARGDWILVLPAELRLTRGWSESVAQHLERGGETALLVDAAAPRGWMARFRAPSTAGVLIRREALGALGADIDAGRLRRHAGRAPRLS